MGDGAGGRVGENRRVKCVDELYDERVKLHAWIQSDNVHPKFLAPSRSVDLGLGLSDAMEQKK